MKTPELNSLVAKCESSSEIIATAFAYQKTKMPKVFSLGWVCKRAKISSRGYLSAVIKKRRILNLKYRESICYGLGLDEQGAEFLKTYIDYDHARPEVQPFIAVRLKELKKRLALEKKPLPVVNKNAFLTQLVYGAFGLFDNKPTATQIQSVFSTLHFGARDVQNALENLVAWGVVEDQGSHYFLKKSTTDIIHVGQEGDRSQIDLFNDAMKLAAKHWEHDWYHRANSAHMYTQALAVRKDVYEKAFDEISEMILAIANRLEAKGDGDMLMLYNVQLGPIAFGAKK